MVAPIDEAIIARSGKAWTKMAASIKQAGHFPDRVTPMFNSL